MLIHSECQLNSIIYRYAGLEVFENYTISNNSRCLDEAAEMTSAGLTSRGPWIEAD